MIEKMNTHYSFTNPATIHDEEALTALELVGRTTAKVNEVVEDQNTLRQETENHMEAQDENIQNRMSQFPYEIAKEVDNHIKNGSFDRQIDVYAGNLEKRVENLLGSVSEGATTMDAEVIDIRVGADNVVYTSAGEAVRKQVGQVTALLTQGEDYYKNLLNPADLTLGYVDNLGKVYHDTESYYYTPHIYVKTGDVLWCNHHYRYATAYDINGNCLTDKGEASSSVYNYIVPDGVHSVVFTISTSHKNTAVINKGVFSLANASLFPYEAVTRKVEMNNIEGFTGVTEYSNNLIDPNKILRGMYLSGTRGLGNALYCIGAVVPVALGDMLTFNDEVRFIHIISGEGTLLSTMSNVSAGTVRATASGYMVFTCYTNSVDSFMLNRGNVLLPYEKGGYRIAKSALPSLDTADMTKLCYLPTKIVVAVGRTLELYNNNVCVLGDKYLYRWSCDIGEVSDRKISITGTEETLGTHSLTCTVMDGNGSALWTGLCEVEVVSAVVASGSVVVPIGDSWTNSKPWLPEVVNLCKGNLSFVGHYTFTGADADGNSRSGGHEGRSGFSIAAYYNGNPYTYAGGDEPTNNVFWNPSTSSFDFAYYVQNTLNGNVPNAVILLLGINGISVDNTESVTMEKELVDNIRTTYPNMPIVLGVPAIPYTADVYGYPVMVTNFGRVVESVFNGYEKLVICPVSTLFDTANNYPTEERVVNPRSNLKEQFVTDTIHPKTEGYYSLADMVYSALCKLL